MTNLRDVLWFAMALSVMAVLLGCWERYRGRGSRQLLTTVGGTALIAGMLVGPEHRWFYYGSLAVSLVFTIYSFTTVPWTRIRWRSVPVLGFAALVVMMIVLVSLPPGVSDQVFDGVFYTIMGLLAAILVSITWMLYKALARGRHAAR